MEMLLANDRRSVRRGVSVECRVMREHTGEVLAEHGIDLSTEGVLVVSDASVVVGEAVVVRLRVPGTVCWISTSAKVARVVHGRRHNDPGPAIALAFERLDGESLRFLRAALEYFPEPVPMRESRADYAATAALIALDPGSGEER